MSHREVENQSLSLCNISSTSIDSNLPKGQWRLSSSSSTAASATAAESPNSQRIPCNQLNEGTTIRVQPMDYHCGGWDDEHFHDKLRLPIECNVAKGLVVTLEAMSRECIAIALSPTPSFSLGKTYAIHIGAASNLQTVIRRRLLNQVDAVDITIPSPQICSSAKYKKYWICIMGGGKVSVGLGSIPGKNTVGTLDDSLYHALRSGVDAVRFVGVGNSALGRKATSLKVRNVVVSSVPDSGIELSMYDPRNPYSAGGDDGVDTSIDGNGDGGRYTTDTTMDAVELKLWKEYQKQCEKAETRAKRFGVEYKQPQPDAFFKWSEARKLRANVSKGFITGMDIMSQEEKEKARKRKQRFEEEDLKNRSQHGGDIDFDKKGQGGDQDNDMEGDEDDQQQQKKPRGPLPIEQAWDNEELVESMRVDPPHSLYPKGTHENLTIVDSTDTAASEAIDSEGNSIENSEEVATLVPTKIHLFAIDWAAFKQIRTDDIMAFFSIYGPTYVEWLGELSCNVHFEDKYSAARAIEALSRPLPFEIPLKVQEGAVVGDDGGEDQGNGDDEVKEEEKDESMGADEMEVRVRVYTHEAASAAADTTDTDMNININTPVSETNLGAMGWRFCNYPVRKMKSDRFGKRGTRSRCLFRIATSFDVLDERPTSWPKPPPGFTTSRVLGPGSDFKTWNKNKKRRRDSRGGGKRRRRDRYSHDNEDYYRDSSYNSYNDESMGDDGDYDNDDDSVDEFGRSALDRGLNASR